MLTFENVVRCAVLKVKHFFFFFPPSLNVLDKESPTRLACSLGGSDVPLKWGDFDTEPEGEPDGDMIVFRMLCSSLIPPLEQNQLNSFAQAVEKEKRRHQDSSHK